MNEHPRRARQPADFVFRSHQNFRTICAGGHVEEVLRTLVHGVAEHGLISACRTGAMGVVEVLLRDTNVDIMAADGRALEYLAQHQDPGIRRYLLELLRVEKIPKQLFRKRRHPRVTALLGESRMRVLCLLRGSPHGVLPIDVVVNIVLFADDCWWEEDLRQFIGCVMRKLTLS